MSKRLWKWGGIAAMLGGALWALTPLRQDVFGGGRFPESPIFRPFNFVVEVITILLIVGLVALHARHKRTYGRLGTAGVVVIFGGYALGFVGGIPAVLFPSDGLRDVIMIGQNLGFLSMLIAGVGAILLGIALWRARAVPRLGAQLLIIALPVGLPGVIALAAIGFEDSAGLALTVLYGGAWIALGYQLWSKGSVSAQEPSRVRREQVLRSTAACRSGPLSGPQLGLSCCVLLRICASRSLPVLEVAKRAGFSLAEARLLLERSEAGTPALSR